MSKKRIIFMSISIMLMLLVLMGTSYAFFMYSKVGEKQNNLATGTFQVVFQEESGAIYLKNVYPMKDEEGQNLEPFNFSVENKGDIAAKYQISIVEDENNTLNRSSLRYELKKQGEEGEISNLDDLVIKDNVTLDGLQKDTYELRIWLDENTGNEAMGKTWKGKVQVVAEESKAYAFEDYIAPTIKLNGERVMTITKGEEFTDPGIESLSDNVDSLTKEQVTKRYEYFDGIKNQETTEVDTNKEGVYVIYYELLDTRGNKGVAARTINVVQANSEAPVVTLNGDEEVKIQVGENYEDGGASARDELGTELPVLTFGSYNRESIGDYVIKYFAIDKDGNIGSNIRLIHVKDIISMLLPQDTWFTTNNSSLEKSKITSINLIVSNDNVPNDVITQWIASTPFSDIPITAYLINDTENDGFYRIVLSTSNSKIYANPDSLKIFGSFSDDTFSNLKKISGLELLDVSKVVNMRAMFYNCNNLVDIGRLDNWDVSNVTNMRDMFGECSFLTEVGDLSNWDTSKVTNMRGFFVRSGVVNLGNLGGWNTSKVTDMYVMFSGCTNLNNIGQLDNWDVSNVTNMEGIFYECKNLVDIGRLDNWKTSNVTNMHDMFGYCEKIASFGDLSGWDTSKVTTMRGMFIGTRITTPGNLSGWDTSRVTEMPWMFTDAQLSTEITIRGIVTDYTEIFLGAATNEGASITINYVDEATEKIVDEMIKTKSTDSHVYKGRLVS